MLQAAHLGDRQAMVYMAKAYETGSGLGSLRYSQISSWLYFLSVNKFLTYLSNRMKFSNPRNNIWP